MQVGIDDEKAGRLGHLNAGGGAGQYTAGNFETLNSKGFVGLGIPSWVPIGKSAPRGL
jgi:hypothetical protein